MTDDLDMKILLFNPSPVPHTAGGHKPWVKSKRTRFLFPTMPASGRTRARQEQAQEWSLHRSTGLLSSIEPDSLTAPRSAHNLSHIQKEITA